MEPAAGLARRLAQNAEAVCREYLSNGRREGGTWRVGDVDNTPGRSLMVRLTGPDSGKGAAGHWVENVAQLVMLRRSSQALWLWMIDRLLRNIIFCTTPCRQGCASINRGTQSCLKSSSTFPEPLRSSERRRWWNSERAISGISKRPAPVDRRCSTARTTFSTRLAFWT